MLEARLCFVNLKINAGALEEEGQFTGNKCRTKGTLVWRWKNIVLFIQHMDTQRRTKHWKVFIRVQQKVEKTSNEQH